jgi:RNA polymerase sigma-70 factor (ECF subfamily)
MRCGGHRPGCIRQGASQESRRDPRARTYLGTIANGLVIDFWRRRELEQAWLETLAQLPEAHTPSPESRLHFLQTLIEIDQMLDTLKPNARTAFLLAQLDGLTCPQIAERIGMSLATVERYISQALRRCYALQFGA